MDTMDSRGRCRGMDVLLQGSPVHRTAISGIPRYRDQRLHYLATCKQEGSGVMKGLVIGKFYPPHLGHSYLIEYALAHSDSVDVLVCEARNTLFLPRKDSSGYSRFIRLRTSE
jgi:cytidyltransferase-like protein